MIEGFSLLIEGSKRNGIIQGINHFPSLALNHLLFVDDVVLFGKGNLEEWEAYKENMDLFCSSSGMSINLDKFDYLFNNLNEEVRMGISTIFPFKMDPIELGFKYLGY